MKLKYSSSKYVKTSLQPRKGGAQGGILTIIISFLALFIAFGLLAYHHFAPKLNEKKIDEILKGSSETVKESSETVDKKPPVELTEPVQDPVLSDEQKALIKAEQMRREAEKKEQEERERKQRIESNLADMENAITGRKWIIIEVLVEELTNDQCPQSELDRINEEIARAKIEEREDINKVEEILKSVESLDTGKYSPESIEMLDDALKIYPDYEPTIALKRKINAYPYSIKVPEEVATLAEAAQKLRKGDTLIIGKGKHKLTGVFNKGIKIKGQGEKLTTIQCLTQKGSAFALTGSGQRYELSDMTVEGLSYEDNAIERYPLISINANARVKMRKVTVLKGSGHGVAVTGGSLDMSECKVSKNAWDGVSIMGSDSSATIENSEVTGNYEHGVDFWKGASGTLMNLKVNDNIASGVVVMGQGTKVNLEQVQTMRNRHCGILVNTQAEVTLERVFSSENQLSGIVIQDQGTKVKCGITVANNNLEAGFFISPLAEIENFLATTSEGNKGGNVIKTEGRTSAIKAVSP